MSSRGHTQSSSRRDGFSSLNLKYLLLKYHPNFCCNITLVAFIHCRLQQQKYLLLKYHPNFCCNITLVAFIHCRLQQQKYLLLKYHPNFCCNITLVAFIHCRLQQHIMSSIQNSIEQFNYSDGQTSKVQLVIQPNLVSYNMLKFTD